MAVKWLIKPYTWVIFFQPTTLYSFFHSNLNSLSHSLSLSLSLSLPLFLTRSFNTICNTPSHALEHALEHASHVTISLNDVVIRVLRLRSLAETTRRVESLTADLSTITEHPPVISNSSRRAVEERENRQDRTHNSFVTAGDPSKDPPWLWLSFRIDSISG